MKKRVILLILILLNLILSTSGIAQEEIVILKDISVSNPKIDANKIDTTVKTQEQLKNINQITVTKEETSKTNNKINEIQRTTNDRVTTNNIETNTIKSIEITNVKNIETQNIATQIRNIQTNSNQETTQNINKETPILPKNKKPITLKNIFEVNNLDELCGYCGFSGSECINFKNYIIKNSLIVSN